MDQNVSMEEQYVAKKQEAEAAKFEAKYGDIIEEASQTFETAYGKHGKLWTPHDSVGLGKYLQTWESFSQMFEDDSTTRDTLGDYLKVGLGLAAVQYVTMPAQFLASVQPMDDEVGLVYFRELIATTTRGNITKGDVIGNTQGKLSYDLDGYYGEAVAKTTPIAAATGTYTIGLNAPVRPRTLAITIKCTVGSSTSTYKGLDDGEGNIIGNWPVDATGAVTGVVAYATGAAVINLADAGASGEIVIEYHQNLAESDQTPGFQYRLSSKPTRVNYFVLENQYSSLSDYAIRRRFGRALSDDVASASIAQINAAVLGSMVKKLKTAAISSGTVNWDAAAPAGVSVADHRRTFGDSLEAAAQVIDAITGRGAISWIIAGSYGRRILQTLGTEMVRKALPGVYLTGFYQNLPVFYAPSSLVADDEIIVGYRGASWFESPIVYSPFLPVVVVKGNGANVFNRVTGVAHAAGIETVCPGFAARIKITGM